MATHKKFPIFIRIKTTEQEVICVNPQHVASFRILEKATINLKTEGTEKKSHVGDTIWLYSPVGTVTRFTVGLEITQDEFNYVSATLCEYLYLNAQEFAAKSRELEARRLQEWNDKMASPEIDKVEEPAR